MRGSVGIPPRRTPHAKDASRPRTGTGQGFPFPAGATGIVISAARTVAGGVRDPEKLKRVCTTDLGVPCERAPVSLRSVSGGGPAG